MMRRIWRAVARLNGTSGLLDEIDELIAANVVLRANLDAARADLRQLKTHPFVGRTELVMSDAFVLGGLPDPREHGWRLTIGDVVGEGVTLAHAAVDAIEKSLGAGRRERD